jgi:hypothetical protein
MPVPNNQPRQFPASRIAGVLGKSKRAILSALRDVPESSETLVNCQRAKVWAFDALPVRLREELQIRAQQRGHRNALALLEKPPAVWQPTVPLAQLSAATLDKAARLQRALRPMLERPDNLILTEAEFERRRTDQFLAKATIDCAL